MDIKVPAVGESITEAEIGEWIKKSGDYVKRDEIILTLETDKASVEVVAEADGLLTTSAAEGETVAIGAVVATLDTSVAAPAGTETPASASTSNGGGGAPAMSASGGLAAADPGHLSPAVRRVVNEKGLDPGTIAGTGKGGRITKNDALTASSSGGGAAKSTTPAPMQAPKRAIGEQTIERVPMTSIRKRIAKRLVQAQQDAAILTTFNEVDMTRLLDLRVKYKESFEKKYGIRLGFMGFFIKATIEGLKTFRAVNASIDGTDILYHNYYNVGVAVSTPKGLVVPVIKNADQMSLAEIELAIREYAIKARDGKISVDDLMGGTFTISNGGVFGSLMSAPILNPPQSAILGMHKIEKRPVVINDEIVIKNMMYLALSYDHRMIDGKESVSFLVRIKECIEDPSRILLEI